MSREDRVGDATARAEDDNPYNDVNQAEYRRLRRLPVSFRTSKVADYELDESGKSDTTTTSSRSAAARAIQEGAGRIEGLWQQRAPLFTDPPLASATGSLRSDRQEAVLPKRRRALPHRWWGRG